MTRPIDIARVRHFISLAHLDPAQASRAAEHEAQMLAGDRCMVPGCFNAPVTELCQEHIEVARG